MSRKNWNTSQDTSLVAALQSGDCRPNKEIAATFGVPVVKVMRAKAILNYGTATQIDMALAGKSIHSVYLGLDIPRTVSAKKQERGLPTYEQVSEILAIDATSKTGLRWLVDRASNAKAGSEAGCVCSDGYVHMNLLGLQQLGHVVVYFLSTGQWPEKGLMINHINGNRSDNRVENLELVTRQQNFRGYRQADTIGYQVRGTSIIVNILSPFKKLRYTKSVSSIKDAEFAVKMLKDYFIQKWPECYPPSVVASHTSDYTLSEAEIWVTNFMSSPEPRYITEARAIMSGNPLKIVIIDGIVTVREGGE